MSWRQFLIYLKGLSPNSVLAAIVSESERIQNEIISDKVTAEKLVLEFAGGE